MLMPSCRCQSMRLHPIPHHTLIFKPWPSPSRAQPTSGQQHILLPTGLICDMSTGNPRPFVPNAVFLILCMPWYPSNLRRWTRTCLQCQRSKIHRHTTAPLIPFPTPDARFDRIHLDLVGPPIPNITAETIAEAFVANWVARFGTRNQAYSHNRIPPIMASLSVFTTSSKLP